MREGCCVYQSEGMWRRLAQILALLLCILGWVFVAFTLAMDRWRVAQVGGRGGSSVVEAAWFWSDLWKDCYEDSTAQVNCVDFRVLWTVKTHIQAVRGLLMVGLFLGCIGTVLTFFGLECTLIGGDERSKDKMLITASAFHLLGYASAVAAYCLYIHRVLAAFLRSEADPSEVSYEIGAPLYLGLVGCFLILSGSTVHCLTACRANHWKTKHPVVPPISVKGEHTCGRSIILRNASTYQMVSVVVV
ncbi:claudin-10-like [Gymnodraco acuticeps]|uniref:Claudin-10-like n=1 Tax=Gymnodraco acuticeps TaxID=8218 RepID=A0A6P8U7U4_GYMAC|nr:claudin-10-like [Gymnodraco acuticeps]